MTDLPEQLELPGIPRPEDHNDMTRAEWVALALRRDAGLTEHFRVQRERLSRALSSIRLVGETDVKI